jgi:hypothetical protein
MLDNKIHQRPVDRVQADIVRCKAGIRKQEDGYPDGSIDPEMLNNGLKRYRDELKFLKQEIETNREDHSKPQLDLLFSSVCGFFKLSIRNSGRSQGPIIN